MSEKILACRDPQTVMLRMLRETVAECVPNARRKRINLSQMPILTQFDTIFSYFLSAYLMDMTISYQQTICN